jgi:hypothetical protein
MNRWRDRGMTDYRRGREQVEQIQKDGRGAQMKQRARRRWLSAVARVLAEPGSKPVRDALDVAQSMRADFEELARRDLIVEMHEAIPIAGQRAKQLTLLRIEHLPALQLRADRPVLADRGRESFRQDVASDVEQRLEASTQERLRRPTFLGSD